MLRFTESHEITQGGSPIISRRSTNELAMNKKLNKALKDDVQEQNKMKCHFCPSNDAHFTLDDQVAGKLPKMASSALNPPLKVSYVSYC